MSQLPARGPLHDWHVAHGATFSVRDGWLVPDAYALPAQERAALETAALIDFSPLAKLSLLGRGVAALADSILAETPATSPLGAGRFADDRDTLACRLRADHLLLLASQPGRPPAMARVEGVPGIV
ncbi:MAG: hypothetical protein L0Z62_44835, partial [Gemmataceae bacterium]|nr:hypothetical protein [Gemmataceae bacterium]